MIYRVWHKELKKFLQVGDEFNLYGYESEIYKTMVIAITNDNKIIRIGENLDKTLPIIFQQIEIGKDVVIDWGFEYNGKKYFENDKVNFKYEGKIMQNFIVIFQNDGSFAMRRIIGHKVMFHYFNSLNKDIVAFGNTRENPELMEVV